MDEQDLRIFDICTNLAAANALFESIGDKVDYYDLSRKEPQEAINALVELGTMCIKNIDKAFTDLLHLQAAERIQHNGKH